MNGMFTSKRYATKGICETISLDIQMVIWAMIDQWRQDRVTMDYLQVFELSIERRNSIGIQKVIHTQECPCKSATYYLPIIENPIKTTIWVIDSEEYCMMLLPDEY
ncbi:protein of unknown function [Pelosinus propionicus DSM 13327]|uniref:Uncharacterized protein n=2 Tax=Pelosinus TaxID=365348 RepID=A0A1I4Q4C2_9FIRM|nr:protein of unknown function [Pelosinus propionicus DSM 13327]